MPAIRDFAKFHLWRPSCISKFKIAMIFSHWRCRVDDSCQMWSISGKPLWSYRNICKFHFGVSGHLGCCKISLLNLESSAEYPSKAWVKILWQSDVNFPSYSNLYKNPRWLRRPSCLLNFQFFSILPCCGCGVEIRVTSNIFYWVQFPVSRRPTQPSIPSG